MQQLNSARHALAHLHFASPGKKRAMTALQHMKTSKQHTAHTSATHLEAQQLQLRAARKRRETDSERELRDEAARGRAPRCERVPTSELCAALHAAAPRVCRHSVRCVARCAAHVRRAHEQWRACDRTDDVTTARSWRARWPTCARRDVQRREVKRARGGARARTLAARCKQLSHTDKVARRRMLTQRGAPCQGQVTELCMKLQGARWQRASH